MSEDKAFALEPVRVRVKPKTVRDVAAVAQQQQEMPPDVWRAAIERGLPIVALLHGADPYTRYYGCYTEEELTALLEPVSALIQGFLARRGMVLPAAAHVPSLAVASPVAPAVPPSRAALPFDADASDALAGLGIDLGL